MNILALLILLGLCWAAMVWLSGRHGRHIVDGGMFDDGLGFASGRRDIVTGPRVNDRDERDQIVGLQTCEVCEGVGAFHDQGRVVPCVVCAGTGVTD